MIAKITSPELAQDVPGAEALISRHMEHRAEINSREEAFSQFYTTGAHLISQVFLPDIFFGGGGIFLRVYFEEDIFELIIII